MELQERYNRIITEYINLFSAKHEVYSEGNIENTPVHCFGDDYLDIDDIRLDIDKDAPVEHFFNWHYGTTDRGIAGESVMNYSSYLMGLRYKDLDKSKNK